MNVYVQGMASEKSLTKQDLLKLLKRTQFELSGKEEQLASQGKELDRKDDVIRQQEEKIKEWEEAYDKLWKERFEARSERYICDPDQLRIDFGETDEAEDAAEGLKDAVEEADLIPAHRRRKPRKKRDESFPDHLERREVVAEIPAEASEAIERGELVLLPEAMWDATETLMYEPAQAWVKVTKYPKYTRPGDPNSAIQSPERPTGIVEGDKYDTGVAAEIITAKYGFHLPVYRQQDMFAGTGWTPGRSTLLNILTNAHFVIEPLLEYFRATVLQDSVIGCDDTGVTLLYPKNLPQLDLNDPKERRIHEVFSKALKEDKPSIRAKMWAYRGVSVKLNVFDFRVSRHRDGPRDFFENYAGTLVGDCYSGFESIVVDSNGAMVRAACNAHARRHIDKSSAYPKERKLWLYWYQQLFDIETRGKTMSPEQRHQLRQAEAQPIWTTMEQWLDEVPNRTRNVILPKSDFRKAIQYIRNHWTELRNYLNDPLVPVDNNEVELLMRQVATGRKNWLFAGSLRGGERSAGFFTLVSSALRNDLDVWQYAKDVLGQLLAGRTDYEPLLPWNWAKHHPDAIRHYRVAERRQRDAAKQTKRADRRKKLRRR